MTADNTRDALLEHGALLFARHGVDGVTARRLHDVVGARNESALHYHFGGRDGLVAEILERHLAAIEQRRAVLVERIADDGDEGNVRRLLHALAQPMATDLDEPLGRAHLRLVARLNQPAFAYERPFRIVEAPAGTAVVQWLRAALEFLPGPVRAERLVALRDQLIALFGARAQLLDEQTERVNSDSKLFLENLLDTLAAGLLVDPSPETLGEAGVAPRESDHSKQASGPSRSTTSTAQ